MVSDAEGETFNTSFRHAKNGMVWYDEGNCAMVERRE